jgi:enoyl-CoA hydratase/carnithine racemase
MSDYQTFHLNLRRGIARVSLDNGEFNLIDARMIDELMHLLDWYEANEEARVLILESANRDFFSGHADINHIRTFPEEMGADELYDISELAYRIRHHPKPSIAKIEGRARGGGSELALACDMRFGAFGRCVMCLPEASGGLFPVAGGLVHTVEIIGAARAMEVLIGCGEYDAQLAERYGLINRALPPEEIDGFVGRLSLRIASFAPSAVRTIKALVIQQAASRRERMIENRRAYQLLLTPERRAALIRELEAGLQTREVELASLEGWLDRRAAS